jgi:hypothetical protein
VDRHNRSRDGSDHGDDSALTPIGWPLARVATQQQRSTMKRGCLSYLVLWPVAWFLLFLGAQLYNNFEETIRIIRLTAGM